MFSKRGGYESIYTQRLETFPSTHVVILPEDHLWHEHYYVPSAPISGRGIRDIFASRHKVEACRDLYNHRFDYQPELKNLAKNGFPIDKINDWTPDELEQVTMAFCPETPNEAEARESEQRDFRIFSQQFFQYLRSGRVGGSTDAHGDEEEGAHGDGEAGAHGDEEEGANGEGEAGALGDEEEGALGDGEAGELGDGAFPHTQIQFSHPIRSFLIIEEIFSVGNANTTQPTSVDAQEDGFFPLSFQPEKKCPICMETNLPPDNFFLELPCRHLICSMCYRTTRRHGNEGCAVCKKPMVKEFIKRL
jgi:hypothetical protein